VLSAGRQAEQLALDFLRGRGLELLARNYRCRRGEIDLVMREGQTVVFVEVRLRRRGGYGTAADSVTAAKRDKLIHSALHFLGARPGLAGRPVRFDVMALSALRVDEDCWIRNAFDVER